MSFRGPQALEDNLSNYQIEKGLERKIQLEASSFHA
jgi:hypothetical protein